MRLLHKAHEGETIQYLDVISLYPYIWKYFMLTVGRTFMHLGDAWKDWGACLRTQGLIKYSIVPPEWLYLPVLPFRANQKLIFSLPNMCPNLEYRVLLSQDRRGESSDW